MHRLSGIDAAFIYDERSDEPQHTLKVAIWSPAASAGHSLERARAFVRARLPGLPPLRWQALRVPFDLHHPVWVDRGCPDLDHHVRRARVASPGGRRELCEAISEIASRPLDPARPLWELWLLEGYEGDRVVAALKLSHALADGGECRRLIERLYSQETPRGEPIRCEPLPSKFRLLRDAVADHARGLRRLRLLARRALAVRRRARVAAPEPAYTGPQVTLFDSPPTPFGGRLSERRAFHFTTLPLEHAKEVRRSLGCTLNDVVIATAAGAARRYLRAHRALPGVPTIGMMPASTREDAERGSWGNRITSRPLTLPTHVADPIARLRICQQVAGDAKADLALRRGANLEDWLGVLPPFAAKLLSRAMRTLVRIRPELSGGVTVSNVKGPAEALHAGGGPVENFVSVGHMKYAAGVNMTIWSYAGQLSFGLYACAEAVPDLWLLADQIDESFEELRKAAARESTRVAA